MFYVICDGQIVDTLDKRPSWEELKRWANALNAEAYVIRGEHAGMSAEPDIADGKRRDGLRLPSESLADHPL